MALVLNLVGVGVGEYVTQSWGPSVGPWKSGDLQPALHEMAM